MWGKSSPGFRESSPPDKLAASVGLPTVIAKGVDITQLFNGSANQSFPPRTWLGFGLDMTTITPCMYFPPPLSVRTDGKENDYEDKDS